MYSVKVPAAAPLRNNVRMATRRLAALSAQLAARPALAAADETQEIAVIVGGGPGISGACARLFASEGMIVAIAQRSPEKPAIQSIIDASPGQVFAYKCDAADATSVAELFEAVKAAHAGVIRCVVFNPSGRAPGPVVDLVTTPAAPLCL